MNLVKRTRSGLAKKTLHLFLMAVIAATPMLSFAHFSCCKVKTIAYLICYLSGNNSAARERQRDYVKSPHCFYRIKYLAREAILAKPSATKTLGIQALRH